MALEPVTVFSCASRISTTGWVVSSAPETPGTGSIVIASCVGAPGVTITGSAEISGRLPERNPNTYGVKTFPASVTLLKVTIPPTALTVNVPPSVPLDPGGSATVTAAVELATVFPAESRSVTTGWGVSLVPEAAPPGWVVIVNCVATPCRLGVTPTELAWVSPSEVNCKT